LVLGPFQGPVACTRIAYGKGVCGTTWKEQQTIIVPNVHEFQGHIACSALSNSEIVVPVKVNGEVIAVLDVDSEHMNHFDEIDKHYLEEISQLIIKKAR
jgi:GAF domain-containing protein